MNIVRLPRLGQTMEAGTINLWCLDEGQAFAEGDPMYEVETDKMNVEVEAKQAGVLLRVVVPAGRAETAVGAVLAVTADVGEEPSAADVEAFVASATGGADAAPTEPEPAPAPEPGPTLPAPAPEPSPTPAAPPAPTPEPTPTRSTDRVLVVPKARAVAREHGIDVADVPGSGIGGVVRVADVLRAVAAAATAGQVASQTPMTQTPMTQTPMTQAVTPEPPSVQHFSAVQADGGPAVSERIVVRGVARSMADSMTRSWTQVPQFVQQVSLDARALMARLKRTRYEGTHVTYTDLLVQAVALTAAEVPAVNASFAGEEIIRYSDVNVSIAVATDRGLLVPVVRSAQTRPLADIAAATKDLAERGKAGTLTSDDMTGGTITVSNLGAFGIDSGTPLINPPQAAIVFVGSMSDQVVARDGNVVVEPRLNIAVAFDHRVLDGMAAAGFTSALKARLEAGG